MMSGSSIGLEVWKNEKAFYDNESPIDSCLLSLVGSENNNYITDKDLVVPDGAFVLAQGLEKFVGDEDSIEILYSGEPNRSQLAVWELHNSGATDGDHLIFNGNSWLPTPYTPEQFAIPQHAYSHAKGSLDEITPQMIGAVSLDDTWQYIDPRQMPIASSPQQLADKLAGSEAFCTFVKPEGKNAQGQPNPPYVQLRDSDGQFWYSDTMHNNIGDKNNATITELQSLIKELSDRLDVLEREQHTVSNEQGITILQKSVGDPLDLSYLYTAELKNEPTAQIISYEWTINQYSYVENKVVTDGSNTFSHTYLQPGPVKVTVVAKDANGGVVQETRTFEVQYPKNDNPASPLKVTLQVNGNGTPMTVAGKADCVPSTGAKIVKVNWTWGDGTSEIGGFSNTHTYTNHSKYVVEVGVTDSNGKYKTAYADITV